MHDLPRRAINALILDMDGVLWRDTVEIGSLKDIFARIQDKNLSVAFATNNSSKTPNQYVSKFSGFGVDLSESQIFTSSLVTSEYLSDQFPEGGPVYCIGENGLVSALEDKGFYQDMDTAQAVIVGLDRSINYEKLDIASALVRKGAVFIGTNPDLTYPVPGGFSPGSGTMIAAVSAASGKIPTIIGKPEITIFQTATEYLEVHKDKCLVVGDRLETDILGAQKFGARCAVVLSGVATMSQINEWDPSPDYVAKDLADLIDQLAEKELI